MRNAISSLVAIVTVVVILSLQLVLGNNQAEASGIRDAEIEHTIRLYASPLLRSAGFEPEDVRLHIIKDKALNAFVAKGQRIFLTSGLLMAAERPEQVVGVLAHEIGHISGGHLARLSGALGHARKKALVGQIIGFALGVVTKEGGVMAATSAKSSDIALKGLLKFSRTQERSADQVAIDLLEKTRTSATGLLEFFERLQDQELLVRERQDSYVVTHPLTQDRIAFLRNHVDNSRFSGNRLASDLQIAHDRMVAKLKGFINPPRQTLREYSADDPAISARYARAVALYRDARMDEALKLMDGLLMQAPDDPYFHELKGQIMFENGRLNDALPSYERAVALRPQQPLLRVGLAHVQIELTSPELNKSAINHLEQALRYDRFMPLSWQLAATAYGRNGQHGLSAVALAEHYLLLGRFVDARGQARKAMRILTENSPGWLRGQDIEAEASRARERKTR
ncbi:MAG: M48 family metalloprotease [Pseudomonadota bacterium]|nr:M48 family metalloprotease [Pseudomonadota bacterium]